LGAIVIESDSHKRDHMNPICSSFYQMPVKCEGCSTELPDDAKFCLSCGRSITGEAPKGPTYEDLDPNGFGMLLIGLSFMVFFFSIMPMIFGIWWGVATMWVAGSLMIVVRYFSIREHKREWEKRQQKIEEKKEKEEAKIRCHYCGTLNEQKETKCGSCGASLW